MDGVLNIHKTAGPTSHDVVDDVRRIFGQRKVGHAGTLDPMATGVLVVCLGKATRISEYLMAVPKQYRARMVLGQSTDTQDSTGTIVEERDASGVTRERFEEAVAGFVGETDQVPPAISAVKRGGKPLYKLAREGKVVERQARKVVIYSIEVLHFEAGRRAEAEILANCGSGTYIRTLCADIGAVLGCGGHMSLLERTRVGRFSLDAAVTVVQLSAAASEGRLDSFVVDMADALDNIPAVTIPDHELRAASHGTSFGAKCAEPEGATVRMLSGSGRLIGLGTVASRDGEAVIKPRKVLAEADG